MMKKMLHRLAIAAALVAGLGAPAAGQDKPKKAGAVDEKAAMEAWQKAMTPGEGQKRLTPIVGTFETKVRTWMDPDPTKPPEDTVGSSINTWALGDRYVQMKYEGIMMGETLNGVGYLGFDNVSKKYVSTWMDTAGTGMMWSTGTLDSSGKVLSMKAMVNDPATGKPSPADTKITITDNDHHKLEMWGKNPAGKMTKIMEIEYTRKK
jgi:hypothetical protein